MQLSVSIDLKHHTCTFREVTALSAGTVYNPLIVEIDDPGVSAETLVLTVLRPGETEEILAVSDKFEKVSGHRKLYKSTLNLSVDGVVRWYEEETAKYPNVTLDCIVEVSDATSNYCKTYVPIILRRLSGEVVKGVDGVSPEVSITKDGRALTISVSDISGTKSGVVYDGIDGADGATPVIRVTEVDGVTNIGIKPTPVEAETLTPLAISYNSVTDKPSINGKSILSGDNSAAYLGLETIEHALTVQSSIESEVSRATAAENELTESLQTEVSRATSREGELEGTIISETNRAVSVENSIKASVESEVTRATGAEDELRQSITEVSTGLASHKSDVSNPHSVTAAQTGAYTKAEVDAKVSSVYRYRGSVDTREQLPTSGVVVGDVYNVVDSGANYAWDGSAWDKLSETVDLTPYALKTELTAHTSRTDNPHGVTAEQVGAVTEDSFSSVLENKSGLKYGPSGLTSQSALTAANGMTVTTGTLSIPGWKISKEIFPVTQTSDATYDLSAVSITDAGSLNDAAGVSMASWDTATGLILGGDARVVLNGTPLAPGVRVAEPATVDPETTIVQAADISSRISTHTARTDNPHGVTAAQIGAVTSSTFMTELSSQAGLSIGEDGYTLKSDKSLSLSEYQSISSSFANIYLQLAAGTVSIMGAQGSSSPYVLNINGDTETSGSVICNNSYRIKPQYLPVTQNRAMADGMGTTIYDLTSYELQETSDTSVSLVDANGASVASFDKETGCIQAGDSSIHFNGSWPDSTAEVIEKDHLIRGNEIQGDKVGYPIYTVGDDGVIKDRCINIVDTTGKTSWTAVFPESATAADFAIVYTCGCAPTFPDGLGFRTDASLEAFSEWAFVEGSTYLITFTQIGWTVYYASMRELQ